METVKLRDIATFSQGLQVPIDEQATTRSSDEYVRFLRIVDYTDETQEIRYIRDPGSKFTVNQDDIVMIRYGSASMGSVGRGKKGVIANNIFKISPDESLVVKGYLYYTLQSQSVQEAIWAANASSTMPAITFGVAGGLDIPLPCLTKQRQIATILSAYDELIENSQRRIRILESMARALYREWFVDFRFPGHEKHPRVGSLLGEIPKGWEVKSLFDVAKVAYGRNLPTKQLVQDGPYPVYGAAKIIGRYTLYTREDRTLICGCRGSVGEMQITEPRCFVTNNSFTFDPTIPDSFFWFFHALKERGLRDVVGGTAQPQITLESISSIECAIPPPSLRSCFQQKVSPMFDHVWILRGQTQNLRRTRDLLLSGLLSGQVKPETKQA